MAPRAQPTRPIDPTTHHVRTGARKATTPETPTPRPAPSVAQVLANQKADQVINRRGDIIKTSPAAPLPAIPETQLPVPSGPHSEEAFERNLLAWGSGAGTPLSFNALDGHYQSMGGEKVDVGDIIFVAHLDETRRGWIRFNGEGNPPTVVSINIAEDGFLPERAELGDTDQSLWPYDKRRGEQVDPWQLEYRVPIVSTAPDGAIFELTSRSLTAIYAFRALLDRYGRHPQRRKKLLPLIKLQIGTYFNKTLGTNKPKPIYQITGWCQKDGSAPATKPDPISSGYPFNDEIPH